MSRASLAVVVKQWPKIRRCWAIFGVSRTSRHRVVCHVGNGGRSSSSSSSFLYPLVELKLKRKIFKKHTSFKFSRRRCVSSSLVLVVVVRNIGGRRRRGAR